MTRQEAEALVNALLVAHTQHVKIDVMMMLGAGGFSENAIFQHLQETATECKRKADAVVNALMAPVVPVVKQMGGHGKTDGTQREGVLMLLDVGGWFSCVEAASLGVPGTIPGIQATLRSIRAEGLPVAGAFCGDGVYRYRLMRTGETEQSVKQDALEYKKE